jgi:phage replication O-like protein O
MTEGWTKIPHVILKALARVNLYPYELRVLCVIMEKTYGWHKDEDWISLKQFEKETGLKYPLILRSLRKLLDKGIITKKKVGRKAIYSVQNDTSLWNVSRKIHICKDTQNVSERLTKSIVGDSSNVSVERYTKESLTKQNIPKKLSKEKAEEKNGAYKIITDVFKQPFPKSRFPTKREIAIWHFGINGKGRHYSKDQVLEGIKRAPDKAGEMGIIIRDPIAFITEGLQGEKPYLTEWTRKEKLGQNLGKVGEILNKISEKKN